MILPKWAENCGSWDWAQISKPTVFENFTVMENLLLAAPRDKRVKKSLFSRLDPEAQLALDESLEQIRLKEFVKSPQDYYPAWSKAVVRNRHVIDATSEADFIG